MIQLSQILSAEQTYMENFGASKKRILQTIAERLSMTLETVSEFDIFDQLIARERLGSTGIGSGFAVPHCRLEGLSAPLAALIKIPEAVDFDAIDSQPVDLIFALVVPVEATDDHLQLLANVVEQVSNPEALANIKSSQTPLDLYNHFIGN